MANESQIIRLPKKYGELIFTLSDEEAGKILKRIFWKIEDLEWMTKIYSDIIISDVSNMELSAINWKNGGRPKTEKPQVITPGYKKEKPQVIKNNNLNEREREREENIKENKKEKSELYGKYEEFKKIEQHKLNITELLVVYFFDLWYIPAKDETLDNLRDWIVNFAKMKKKTPNQMRDALLSWHTYWKEQKKQIKNFKTSFQNHYSFKD